MSLYSYVRYEWYNLLNIIFQPLFIAVSIFSKKYTVISIFVLCKVYVYNKVYWLLLKLLSVVSSFWQLLANFATVSIALPLLYSISCAAVSDKQQLFIYLMKMDGWMNGKFIIILCHSFYQPDKATGRGRERAVAVDRERTQKEGCDPNLFAFWLFTEHFPDHHDHFVGF